MLHWKFLKKSESILTTELRRCHSLIPTVHWKDSISPPQKLPWHLRGLGKVGNEWKWQIRQISKEKSRDASYFLTFWWKWKQSVQSLTAKPLIFSMQAFSWTCCGNNFLALVRQGPLHEKMVALACTKTSSCSSLNRDTPPVNSVTPWGSSSIPFFLAACFSLSSMDLISVIETLTWKHDQIYQTYVESPYLFEQMTASKHLCLMHLSHTRGSGGR